MKLRLRLAVFGSAPVAPGPQVPSWDAAHGTMRVTGVARGAHLLAALVFLVPLLLASCVAQSGPSGGGGGASDECDCDDDCGSNEVCVSVGGYRTCSPGCYIRVAGVCNLCSESPEYSGGDWICGGYSCDGSCTSACGDDDDIGDDDDDVADDDDDVTPPSNQTLTPSQATFVQAAVPGQNFSTGQYGSILRIQSPDSFEGEARALVQWNLSGAAGSASELQRATMTLGSTGTTNQGNEDLAVSAHRATGSWTESTVTWDSQPAFSGTGSVNFTIPGTWSESSSPVAVDVTGLVQEWLLGTTNNGVLLLGVDGGFYSYKSVVDTVVLTLEW